ncbi:MAG: MBL fold metallo-hydrolase, partial [Chloroflexi bacterium]
IHIPLWHASVDRLRRLAPERLLLTHFGPVEEDAQTHLDRVDAQLDAYADFFRSRWQAGQSTDEMTVAYRDWVADQARADGCDEDTVHRLEVVVPSYMQAAGMVRYFRKHESGE